MDSVREIPDQSDAKSGSLANWLKWVYNRLLPTILTGLALVVLWVAGQHSEPIVHNLFLRWGAKPASHSPVTLVLIDDESLDRLNSRFGPPPWPRSAYLEIFKAIQAYHPSVMAFDSHFVSLDQKQDSEFFTALRQFPNLICGLALEESEKGGNRLNTRLPEYYALHLGVVSVNEDQDGVVRSIKPFYQGAFGPVKDKIFPALSMAVVQQYLERQQAPGSIARTHWQVDGSRDGQNSGIRIYPEQQPQRGVLIPLDGQGKLGLRWEKLRNQNQPEYARSHPAIPLWRFFAQPKLSQQMLSQVQDKIVIIGASSSFHRDYHQTPMANRHLGPDIHATAIDNLLSGVSVRQASPWMNLSILIFLSPLVFFLRLRYRSLSRTLLYTLGAIVIYCWVTFWCLSSLGWRIDVVTPSLFMLAAMIAASTCRISDKEKQLAAMEKNLSQLVDPEVFREIRRMAHVLAPGGQKLEITSLFVDIRNFTALAEHLQPQELTDMLNEFYEQTVRIVFRYQGTIDKFMGDGILVIFGAPLQNTQHRLLALRAAKEILQTTGQLSRRWLENQGIDTEIGITLNSGPAFVGFFGPADKLEYTGVGDTVNICVRLQEHTKQFHTRLIISESTLAKSEDPNQNPSDSEQPEHYIPLGKVQVRGREGAIHIFTLTEASTS